MNKTITTEIARAILATSAAFAAATAMMLAAGPSPAWAQAAFAAIGTGAEYRIDGVREGVYKGAPVRFVDITIKNLAPETTFPRSILEVWWQGRTVGGEAQPLQRDGQPFGMHTQYIRQGQVVAISYPIPVRDDLAGVTLEFKARGADPRKRAFTWAELAAPTR
jgi:hypothetical protein